MPRQEQILTVFVASPSDVMAERKRLEEVIDELNQTWSRSLAFRLDLIRWETHSYPGFGADAQDVVNRQIPDDWDIFIGIMWHRFGTPTGRAESGSQEEFLRAKARWDKDPSSVQLMIYFKEAPISPNQIDPTQLEKVKEYRKSLGDEGSLYWSFQSTDDFVNFARMHLARVVQEWKKKLPIANQSQSHSPKMDGSLSGAQPEGDEVGLIELSELVEDSLADAYNILTSIVKSSEGIGKKIHEHTKRVQAATAAGNVTRTAAKRMIAKVATDMNGYANKLDQDIPSLNDSMSVGLSALSQVFSSWPDISQDDVQRNQVTGWISQIENLRTELRTARTRIQEFRYVVDSMPRMTSDLIRAKRSLIMALDKFIDLLQTQEQVLTQTEKSATTLIEGQVNSSQPDATRNQGDR